MKTKTLTLIRDAHGRIGWLGKKDIEPPPQQFRVLRASQKRMEAESKQRGFFTIACHDCNQIERRLIEKGVKL